MTQQWICIHIIIRLPYIKSYASFYLTPNQESQNSWSYKKEHKSVPKKKFHFLTEYANTTISVQVLDSCSYYGPYGLNGKTIT